MMQQQYQQPRSATTMRRGRGRLAAAFALASRGASLEESAFMPAAQQQQQQMTKQSCPMPEPMSSQQQQQQQYEQYEQYEQQIPEVVKVQEQQQEEASAKKNEAAEFLEKNGIPTFVPVFQSTSDIEPRRNESLKGQVPWKCAHCSAHSFGHHCMTCVRHRDSAALRVFVGQLCKEGSAQIVQKIVDALCPELSAPAIFVEPHTDASSGRGKGCAWIYVNSIADIHHVVKSLNKRTFVTVDESSGNVGFVAFPPSFTNQEIEQAFQVDHDAQSPQTQSLFMFTCISAQVPKALQNWGALAKNNNSNKNKNQQQQQQGSSLPPPPPTYSAALPVPPTYIPQQQKQQQNMMIPNTQIPDISCQPTVDNRQIEEQQMMMRNQQQSNVPTAYLGQHYQVAIPVVQQQQQQQYQPQPTSWVNNSNDDDNYFPAQHSGNNMHYY